MEERNLRKERIGVVSSNKCDKTIERIADCKKIINNEDLIVFIEKSF